jgi:hypothetical protein
MREGWYEDDYLLLFDPDEVPSVSARYEIARWLPAYSVIGLRSWEALLVQDAAGGKFSVPCVPISNAHLTSVTAPPSDAVLAADARLSGKIMWRLTPIAFGGSPTDEANVHWVTPEQHAQLVVFWNARFLEAKAAAHVQTQMPG